MKPSESSTRWRGTKDPVFADLRSVGLVLGVVAAGLAMIGTAPTNRGQAAVGGVLLLLAFFLNLRTLKQVLVSLAVLDLAIPIDIFVGFDPVKAETNTLSGIGISLSTGAILILYILWSVELIGKIPMKIPRKILTPAIVYPAAVLISLAVATDPGLVASEAVIVIQGALLLIYVAAYIRVEADLTFILVFMMVGLAVQGLYVLASFGPLSGVEFGPFEQNRGSTRPDGTFGSPNVLGAYLTMVIPVAAGFAASKITGRIRLLTVGATSIGLVALLLSRSRGAWAGAALALGVLLILLIRKRWLPRSGPLVLMAFGIVLLAAFGAEVGDRLSDLENSTIQGRIPLMRLAGSMIADHPIFGVGANHFAASLPYYLTPEYIGAWISTVHNKYLLVWAETGLIGLGGWLFMLGSGLRSGFTAWRLSDRHLAPIAAGLALGLAGGMVHAFGEIYHARVQVQLIMMLVGMSFAIARLAEQRAPTRLAGRTIVNQ